MKTPYCFYRWLRSQIGLLTFACLTVSFIPARAGLTFNLQISHGYGYYYCYPSFFTNSTPPDASQGGYVISSPTNAWTWAYQLTGAGMSYASYINNSSYGNFDAFLNQLTNGNWTILFTNAVTTNLYTFNVSVTGVDSNSLPNVTVTYPMDGSVNVPNNTTFTWDGPTAWGDSVFVEDYDPSFTFSVYGNPSTSDTNWTFATPLTNGDNTFYVSYSKDASAMIAASQPVDGSSQPIAGWASGATLNLYAYANFSVTGSSGGGSGGHTLEAYYSFEDNQIFPQDFSGHGYNINGYSGSPYLTNDAAAGVYAYGFSGDTTLYPPTNLVTTLAGSFSVSLWLKTTQVTGSDTDDGLYGDAGIVAAFNGSGVNWVVPMALTGNKLAFATGGSTQDTLHSLADINTGSYVHLVVTRDQTTGEKRIYVNGVLDNSDYGSTDPLDTPTELDIGYNNGSGLDGTLDDIQIYQGVLSAAEVQQLYNNPGTTIPDAAGGGDLATALDATNLTWTTGGDANWFVETTNTYDGVSAAQSGLITDNQTNYIETTVPNDGQISFYWMVSSEQSFDYLTFYINGIEQDAISGAVGWNQEIYSVSAGDTLRWEYSKDGSASQGADAGWLDQVQFQAATGLPFTFTTNSAAITITGYTGTGGAVTIPDTINSYPVTTIANNAFFNQTSLSSVLIGTNVTTIGDFAFAECYGLSSVTIPNSVTNIGTDAFTFCFSLSSITIPSSVASIGYRAFGSCINLPAISVAAANTNYSSLDGVLFDHSQTTLIQFPAGKTGSYLVPGSVTSIGDIAFDQCKHLTSVTIPMSVTNIGANAFEICSSLTSIVIPDSVTTLGSGAFRECYSLASITIPSSISFIQSFTFENCGQLTNITVPASVTTIDAAAFNGCTNLAGLYFQGNAPYAYTPGFVGATNAVAYYLYGTTGWSSTFAGIPAVLLNPPVPTGGGNFGVQNNQFGFNVSGHDGQTIVVETATNLVHPVWLPIWTNILSSSSVHFSDPQWTNYPGRYYRLKFQ